MTVTSLDMRATRGVSPTVVTLFGIAFTALLFGAIGWAGIYLTLTTGRIASVWLGNSVVIAIMLRTRKGTGLALVGACFAANVAVALSFGDALSRATVLATANALEILATVALMRRLCGQRPDISVPKSLITMLVIGLAVPALSGLLTAWEMGTSGEWFAGSAWSTWYGAHALALMIMTPIILIAIDSWQNRYRPSRRQIGEWLVLVLGTAGASALIFGQSQLPFLFLASPLVLVAAFRSGLLGTAVAVAIVSVVASVATIMGTGPIMLVSGSLPHKVVTLQLFLATNFVIGLPVATFLATRSAMRAQLRESRDFAQDILQNVGEVIFKTDAQGRWTFLNEAWVALTGYSIAESLHWRTTRLLHPEDRAAAIETYKRIVAGEINDDILSQRFFHANGELRHIEVSLRRLGHADGSFAGTIGNIRDVSQRVEQENALKDSERRFQTLADVAPAGIFRTDTNGNCTYVNAAWKRITGLEDGMWEGSAWASAIHPDDLDAVFDGWASAVKQKSSYRAEFRWVHSDGTIAWTDVAAKPEYDTENQLFGFIGVTLDITNRKKAEADLAKRETQLALLANNATDSVMRLALDGECIYASPSSEKLFRVDPAQLVGQNMLDRFHPDDDETARNAFTALAEGHEEHTILAYRAEKIHAPGTYVWMEANCGLVRDPQTGEPAEILASIRDVSETKALEANLRDASARAESAVVSQSAFLANMSHEIRTPMNGVIGFTELALAGDLPPEQRRQIELIAESGRVMMRLLNDILDMAKIESGQMAITREPVNLHHKLHGSVRMMEPVAVTKGVALIVKITDDVPRWILGDQMRIRQVILNLIGNAVKFTEQGTIDVTVSVNRERNPHEIEVSVRDSGIGIAPDRLEVIFDQFAQADGSTARKYGGTGLGLAISQDLATLMGGKLSVESLLGEGSTFTLSLPLEECTAPVAEENDADRADSVPLTENRDRRILIAEDHDINQELILNMAARAGFNAEIAADGTKAIQMVKQAEKAGVPYALMLMDIQMPVLDGLEATRRLRTQGFDAEKLPIIALTANAYAEDVAACLEAGMQGHIAKPIRLRDFAKTVAEWIGKSEAPKTAVAEEGAPSSDLQSLFATRKDETAEAVSAALRQGQLTDATVEELASLFHKIAGTAAFFGQEELGERARTFEKNLRSGPLSARKSILNDALSALKAA